jgi:methyltransferase
VVSSRRRYAALVALVAAERLAELRVARRNARVTLAAGGVETGREHYPVLVGLHTALLAGCLVETTALDRRFRPAVGVPALAGVAAAQALRWWCIRTLGSRWNTRIIVLPGAPLVRRGPYRLLRHPNYVAVVLEGVALPLVHGAWWTAAAFSTANLAVLRTRVRAEDRALGRGPA